MAISAPAKSVQAALYTATPPSLIAPRDASDLKIAYAKLTFTAAGSTTAAAGDLSLLRLPAGKIRVYGHLSRIICPAGTSSSDLDVGWAAHTNTAGATVSADGDGLAASLDVGDAAIDADLATVKDEYDFDSRDGVDIVASFDTAASPASGDMILRLVYSIGG